MSHAPYMLVPANKVRALYMILTNAVQDARLVGHEVAYTALLSAQPLARALLDDALNPDAYAPNGHSASPAQDDDGGASA